MGRRKGIWKYLADLPPIDWEFLASQRRQNVKGEPQPKWWSRKQREVRRANEARRRRAAVRRSLKRWKARGAGRRRPGLDAALLGALQPGQWYARPDIRAASGAKRNSVHARLARYERLGIVERWEDPDFDDSRDRGKLGRVKVLFRLTPAGERARDRALDQHAAKPRQKRQGREPAYCE